MKRSVLLAIFLFAVAGGSFYLLRAKKTEGIHYHAGFVVLKDNAKVDFSDIKYMDVSPCTVDGKEVEHEDDQLEKAHLHDNIGDVVHVHREGAKWSDLFTNIHYPLDYSSAQAYLNGTALPNFQDITIRPYDSLVILINSDTAADPLSQAVTKQHIEETEKRSENCGS